MKRTTATLGVVAVALWATAAFAQGRNFGGNWTVDAERTAAANPAGAGGVMMGGGAGGGRMRSGGGGDAGAAAGAVARMAAEIPAGGGGRGGRGAAGPTAIALDANTFTVGATAYKLDGSVTTTETPNGTITAKAAWKSDKLVIETTSPGPNGLVTRTQTWYLDGESLVREVSSPSPSGGDPIVTKTYYKRA